MRAFILPYKRGSKAARDLSQATGIKRPRMDRSGQVSTTSLLRRTTSPTLIVNYGNSSTVLTSHGNLCVLNKQSSIRNASNKLKSFEVLSQNEELQDHLPLFTQDKALVLDWLNNGKKVVVREKLTGHSGQGISILEGDPSSLDYIPDAPLYVQYIPKQHEYRVHVFCGEVIDVQRKMRIRDVPDDQVNWQVRNFSNGFTYGREGVSLPDVALTASKRTVETLGLDFGAVDLIYNERRDQYYVLEVNTAPGLVGTTLEKYTDAVQRAVRRFSSEF